MVPFNGFAARAIGKRTIAVFDKLRRAQALAARQSRDMVHGSELAGAGPCAFGLDARSKALKDGQAGRGPRLRASHKLEAGTRGSGELVKLPVHVVLVVHCNTSYGMVRRFTLPRLQGPEQWPGSGCGED
jgi:hypothetical protein